MQYLQRIGLISCAKYYVVPCKTVIVKYQVYHMVMVKPVKDSLSTSVGTTHFL